VNPVCKFCKMGLTRVTEATMTVRALTNPAPTFARGWASVFSCHMPASVAGDQVMQVPVDGGVAGIPVH
jgi:hypothetical protein